MIWAECRLCSDSAILRNRQPSVNSRATTVTNALTCVILKPSTPPEPPAPPAPSATPCQVTNATGPHRPPRHPNPPPPAHPPPPQGVPIHPHRPARVPRVGVHVVNQYAYTAGHLDAGDAERPSLEAAEGARSGHAQRSLSTIRASAVRSAGNRSLRIGRVRTCDWSTRTSPVPLGDGSVRLNEAAGHRLEGLTRFLPARRSGRPVVGSEEEHYVVGHLWMMAARRTARGNRCRPVIGVVGGEVVGAVDATRSAGSVRRGRWRHTRPRRPGAAAPSGPRRGRGAGGTGSRRWR